MEKKSNLGCSITIAVIIILAAAVLFWLGNFLKNIAQDITDEEMELQNRLDSLPVLTSDSEITAALNGTPQNYLVKNYVFKNPQLVKDNVFDVLNGQYLCISITQETLTLFRKSARKADESPYYHQWVEKPYCQIFGNFTLNDGTPIKPCDSLTFVFPYIKTAKRIFESEINADKVERFEMSRYYPDRSVNISNPEQVVMDFVKQFKDDTKKLAEEFGDKEITFGSRYNFTYMDKDEEATFAVRLGNGEADFNVFPGKNVIIVGGDKISISSQQSMGATVWKIMSYVLMTVAVIIVLCTIGWFVISVI